MSEIEGDVVMSYTARVIENIDNGKGYWKYQKIGIFNSDGELVYDYIRNYSNFYRTFNYFEHDNKPFALISSDYQSTSVLDITNKKIIATTNKGFCPVDYYIPRYVECKDDGYDYRLYEHEFEESEEKPESIKYDIGHAFVAGCFWGDDWSMKVERLNLSKMLEGEIIQSQDFGYISKFHKLPLKDCITIDYEVCNKVPIRRVYIVTTKMFQSYDKQEYKPCE